MPPAPDKKARWKVKPKGPKTVKKDGWWVPKKATPATTPRTGAPAGGTVRDQKRSQLVPREWVGSEGLIGSWKKPPRLDPTAYEWMKNPENDRWFARPRTELTGLDPNQQATIRDFDTQTKQQEGRISASYAELGRQAEANQAAGSATIAGLAGLMGGGQQSTDPTAATLQTASRAGTAAAVAPIISDLARAPTVARSGGLSNLEAFMAQRGDTRTETITGIRSSNAEADAAQQELNAELRGQDLEHLGRIADNETDITEAKTTAETANKDRLADLKKKEAELNNQLRIAREANQTSRANNIRTNLAKNKKAQKDEKGKKKATPETIRAWAKRAREMHDGIEQKYNDPATGEVRTQVMGYTYAEIVRELQAMGAPLSRARSIADQITGRSVTIGNIGDNFGW